MKHLFLVISVIILTVAGCSQSPAALENGIWRAVLKTDSGVEIPFNFEVSDLGEKKIIYLINGSERLRVDEVNVTEDSLKIKLPLFDSEIKAVLTTFGIGGEWIKHLADKDVSMSFTAEPNMNWRFFETNQQAGANVNGRWSTIFVSPDGKDTTIAIGEFTQKNTKVTGTFLTSTGDYRFLEGNVNNKKLYLSAFDGSHAFLFTANIEGDSSMTNGKFYSGASSMESWTAVRDSNAILPDAYLLTRLKPGKEKIQFAFPDLSGRKVSPADTSYQNKVVVVQFLGSWCPNCMDETAYLTSFYSKYRSRGAEVIGLAYERTNDVLKSKLLVEKLRDRFKIQYPLLITGFTNKEVLKSIPDLNEFNAFPTTIIIDKKGKVRKIHTGFSGPGTGSHYKQFIREFEEQIDALLAE